VKYLHLIARNLLRKKVRTVFTLLSVLVAFVLFGYLSAINMAFRMGVDLTGADRLLVIHKVSLIQSLPQSYEGRIAAIAGVRDVAHASWFGGVYQEPSNFFAQMAVEPERYLRLYPEFLLPEDQKKAWLADRTGAVVGRQTASRFGWKLQDRIPIQGTFYRKRDGGRTWEFTIDGIYEGKEKGTDTTQFLFHYDYLDEARQLDQGSVGWYIVRVADPERAPEIGRKIDAAFANSSAETKTTTEKAFAQSFANQVGNIGAIIQAIVIAVFFTLLLVAGNTMAQAVRERTGELAVLKTVGFSGGKVMGLVLAESLLLVGLGGGIGLALAWGLTSLGDPTGGFLPIFFMPAKDLVVGAALIVALGLVSGAVPAVRAMRLAIADALRRG